jgi:hypothetical protein
MAKHRGYRYAKAYASGPDYPSLGATVAKWRWRACDGLQSLTREERRAYGEAVERAILALQRSEANQGFSPITPKCRCASGTAHNTGEAIHEAIREQQRAAILAAPAQIRRARSDVEWQQMYEAAMAEKHANAAIREAA